MASSILVTGGAGYIGSHTCKALARAGYQPIAYDNLSRGHARAVKWGPLVPSDLADSDALRAVIQQYDIKAVMHFAAYAYVGESMQDPRSYFKNNVADTLNLLNVILEMGVNRIVFSSSCATYGVSGRRPIDEEHPQRPINPYGETKLMLERALHWYGGAYNLRSAVLRYFNAAGADLDGEIGEDHDPETHLIPLTIQTMLGQRPYFSILGTDYDTRDGTAIRDFIHVQDLATAHVRALEHLLYGGKSISLNLGTGEGHSVRDVIKMVETLTGTPMTIREELRRPGDPPILIADPRRANSMLGWAPEYSNLATIVETAWLWQVGEAAPHGVDRNVSAA